jgi:RNA polymerase sigma factor (sigma-70 family)
MLTDTATTELQPRRLSFSKHLQGATDGQLLQRFATARDEIAFATLVQRYGGLVLGVCRRRLQHEQDAEDAFQATFLVLARKAGAIDRWELLGNWLYGVASRTAAKARARAVKRRIRELPLPEQPVDGAPEAVFDDLRPILDEEVSQLPSKYRQPFVLCYLEGKTNEEAARHLGCPKGTVQSRLAWARARLRNRLSRRGVALAGELPAGLLLHRAAVSPGLVDATTKLAVPFAFKAAISEAVSPSVTALAEGVLHTMFVTRLTVAAVVTLALVFLGASGGAFASRILAEQPAAAADDDSPRQASVDKRDSSTQTRNGRTIVTEKEAVSKSFRTGRSPRVVVEVFCGNIDVVAQDADAVDVNVTKQGGGYSNEEAKRALSEIHVDIKQDGDTIKVTASRERRDDENSINTGASASLKVPAGAALDLHTDFGGIASKGVRGDLHADTTSGNITATGTKGPLRLMSQFGSIEIEGDSPNVDASTASGRIKYVGGRATKLKLRSQFGEIDVHGDTRDVDAHTESGNIHVRDGKGRLDLVTQFGEIDARGTDVALKAETTSGSVRFAGTLADGENSLISHFGSVTVTLPESARFQVEADTNFGGIHSDFRLSRSTENSRTRVHGSVGDHPAMRLRLHTDSGSISIRRQK